MTNISKAELMERITPAVINGMIKWTAGAYKIKMDDAARLVNANWRHLQKMVMAGDASAANCVKFAHISGFIGD